MEQRANHENHTTLHRSCVELVVDMKPVVGVELVGGMKPVVVVELVVGMKQCSWSKYVGGRSHAHCR